MGIAPMAMAGMRSRFEGPTRLQSGPSLRADGPILLVHPVGAFYLDRLLRLASASGRRGAISSMPEVIIHDDENFERALRRFKKKCEKAGILSDLRKHRHYEKPSEKRKRKQSQAHRKGRRIGDGYRGPLI